MVHCPIHSAVLAVNANLRKGCFFVEQLYYDLIVIELFPVTYNVVDRELMAMDNTFDPRRSFPAGFILQNLSRQGRVNIKSIHKSKAVTSSTLAWMAPTVKSLLAINCTCRGEDVAQSNSNAPESFTDQ